eukprot:scaffold3671_cov61-Phaeocystis_antarctica.AAC.2
MNWTEIVRRTRWNARPPATQLAAPASPSQQPSLALAAAARTSLDASELQDVRGSKCPPEVRRVRPPLSRGRRPAGSRPSRLHSPPPPQQPPHRSPAHRVNPNDAVAVTER